MDRGKVIISWTEPSSADKAARQLSKAVGSGRSTLPWPHALIMTLLCGILVVWKWFEADPTTRANLPSVMVVFPAYFIFWGIFFGIYRWGYFWWNRTTTTIHEAGISHGSRFHQQWIPWSHMEYFFTDEDQIGSVRLRFLNWKEQEQEEEEYSVLPDDLDTNLIVSSFLAQGIEQAEGSREAETDLSS